MGSLVAACEFLVVALGSSSPTPGASLMAQLVKNLPAMQETPVQFLDQEDPLEKGRATHSQYSGLENSFGLYSPWSCNESDMTERLSLTP